ncbi:MAG: cation:proton antiporter [Planctomycetota bacterium]
MMRHTLIAIAGLSETLLELSALFALCVFVGVLFQRIRIPAVVGFLFAGALIGPNGLALVRHPEMVEQLAELGVVMLLFTVGTELSITRLAHLRRAIFLGGGLQLALTIGLGALAASIAGMAVGRAVFLGFMLALSSTAAITKLLAERRELNAPASRLAIAVCIAQDLAVVPMLVLLPILGGSSTGVGAALVDTMSAMALLGGLTAIAWFLVPRILDVVARTRSRELYLLTVLVQCLLLALATSALGLSLALGAFLSGLVIGASDHHHQAVSEVEPFRDALSSLFFVSIGMLFDVRTIAEQPLFLGVALGVVVFGKAVLAFVAIRALGMPSWTSLRAALMLSQVGEFSFVLAQLADEHALLQVGAKRVFLVVAVASIALTPALFWIGRIVGRGQSGARRGNEGIGDHVVVVGFGPAGQGLARSLHEAHIPVRVVEMNPETVHRARREGVDIIAGDASRVSVLEALEIRQARLLVVATNDPESTRRIVQMVRQLAPSVHILVRTSYLAEVPGLERLGADEIVPQELETGVELTARALRHFLVPDDHIERAVAEIRERAYSIRRVGPAPKANTARLSQYVPGLSVMAFHVEAGSPIANRTLGEAELRRDTGLSIVAIRRAGITELNIRADTVLQPGDIVIGIGAEAARPLAAPQFRGPTLTAAELRPNTN